MTADLGSVGKGEENRVFPKRWEEFLGAVSEAEKRPHLARSPSSLPTGLPTAKQGERRTRRPSSSARRVPLLRFISKGPDNLSQLQGGKICV